MTAVSLFRLIFKKFPSLIEMWTLCKKKSSKNIEKSCAHSAVWVPSISKVLITGGFDGNTKHKNVRILNEHGELVVIKSERAPKSMIYHFTHLASNGKVYIVGISPRSNGVLTYMTYDTKSNKWSRTGLCKDVKHRVGFSATSIAPNTFLLFGGQDPKTKELYNDMYRLDIGSNGKMEVTTLSSNDTCRAYAAAAFDGEHRMFFFGGSSGKNLRTHCVEMLVYNILENQWETPISCSEKTNRKKGEFIWPSPRVSPSLTALLDPSKFLLCGGDHKENIGNGNGLFMFDSKSRIWTKIRGYDELSSFKSHSATLLPNGSVMLHGGYSNREKEFSNAVNVMTRIEEKEDDEVTMDVEESKEDVQRKEDEEKMKESRFRKRENVMSLKSIEGDDGEVTMNVEDSSRDMLRRYKRKDDAQTNSSTPRKRAKNNDESKDILSFLSKNQKEILSAIKIGDEERKLLDFEISARRAELLRSERVIQELNKEKFVLEERLMHTERRLKESQTRENELRSYHEKLDRALSSTSTMTNLVKELSTLKSSYLEVCSDRDMEKRLKENLIEDNRRLVMEFEALKRKFEDRNRKFEKFFNEIKGYDES